MSGMWLAGHGHVRPRADGVKARCGGPVICSVCAQEQAAFLAAQQQSTSLKSDEQTQPTDSEMLDWLERKNVEWVNVSLQLTGITIYIGADPLNTAVFYGQNLRDAIRAAMKDHP